MPPQPTQPEIIEFYKDYSPPLDVTKIIRRAITHTPPHLLRGLQSIVLTNSGSFPRDRRRQKTWSRGKKFLTAECLGLYHCATEYRAAWIELLVNNILHYRSPWESKIPGFRDFDLVRVFFHELGHHIHATQRPEHTEKEDVADKWADKLHRKYIQNELWYLLPAAVVFVPVLWIVDFSNWLTSRLKKSTA